MHRFCVAAVVTLMVTLSSSIAADEQTDTTSVPASLTASSPVAITSPSIRAAITASATASPRATYESSISLDARPPTRPIVLPALYAGFITLQALDTSYTLRALPVFATEANPLMRGVTKYPAAFVALKAGLTIGGIMHSERLWKNDHRVAAVVLMAASNGLMAVVVARNASVLQKAQLQP